MKTHCLGFFPGSRSKSRAVRWVFDWSVDKRVRSLSWRHEFKAKKEEKKVTDGDSGGWAFTSVAFRNKITLLQTALYVPNTSPLKKHRNQRSSEWLSPDNSRQKQLQLTRSQTLPTSIHRPKYLTRFSPNPYQMFPNEPPISRGCLGLVSIHQAGLKLCVLCNPSCCPIPPCDVNICQT